MREGAAAERGAWLELWREASGFRALLGDLARPDGEGVVTGVPGGLLAFLVAGLRRFAGAPVLVVTPGFREALDLAEDLAAWLPADEVFYFPPLEVVPYHVMARSHDLAGPRLRCLAWLAGGGAGVVVAPAAALPRALSPREAFAARVATLRRGERAVVEEVAAVLAAGGYERADRVEMPGQMARRGGIVDAFPPGQEEPVRLEFFGDAIESIRRFDPVTQRSLEEVEEAVVWPAREAVPPVTLPGDGDGAWEGVRRAVRREAAAQAERLAGAGRSKEAKELLARIEEQLAAWQPAVAELYLPFLHGAAGLAGPAAAGERAGSGEWDTWREEGPRPTLLSDYFPSPPLVVEVDRARTREALLGAELDWSQRAGALLEAGRLLPTQIRLQATAGEVLAGLERCRRVAVSPLGESVPGGEVGTLHDLGGRSVTGFRGQWPLFLAEVREWLEQGYRCAVTVADERRRERMAASLREAGFPVDGEPPAPGRVTVPAGPWRRGFVAPYLRLALVTEEEVFGQRAARPAGRRPPRGAEPVTALGDLKAGDFVVHLHHGVGQFLGIQTMEVQGVARDYLLIRYAGADRLYVPVEQIHLIQKYAGGEGVEPRLHRLGGRQWEHARRKVRAALRQLAAELLRLEEARRSLPGHAFSPDTVWQREFEEAFPYEETPDQARATEEIKRDMEAPRPMDRILVGDVGFGKTEVAMRAAFKAVMDGKQVAVLVPTTVLAQQHYLTFRERFAGFPVRVAMLTRFQAAREQEEVVTGLRRGDVDVVVGTHRLLGGDVAFRDLGLLIVDEEHRFGVAHKETLKRLRATVDVLAMTATPIPRTLHLALSGLRDMSVIRTPPESRFPVETYVTEYDQHLAGEAIRRELARGGQVFYVHNRIGTIGRSLERIRAAVPEARVAVAHGRLPDEELEAVMMGFLQGEHDVLLCTSIIESGLDIPNANTLVVEDSDRFGLAQLYQLRGRVGRSNRVAYAYFTYRRGKTLTEAAQKRLEAIREFTELGSGFRIALRDLEIRGAGNVLGPEQHGHIAAVGFDLYHQMLEDALREARGERRAPATEPVVELACDAYLPASYVADARSKMEVYRRLGAARSEAEVAEVEEALRDRFGPLPPEARSLLALARVRVRAARLGVLAVAEQRGLLQVTFAGYLQELFRGAEELRRAYGGRLQVLRSPRPVLRLRLSPDRPLGARTGGDGEEAVGGSALAAAEELLAAVERSPAFAAWLAAGGEGAAALHKSGAAAQNSP